MDVRIDVRKLQLLNDRVNQCIDALNEVRGSVRGLSGQVGTMFGNSGLGHTDPRFVDNRMQDVRFQDPRFIDPRFGMDPRLGYGIHGGFQHTSPMMNPFVQTYGTTPYGTNLGGYGVNQNVGWGVSGLSHTDHFDRTNAELRASDFNRIAQTFPYAWIG